MEKFRNRAVSKPKYHPKYPKSERYWIQNFFRYQIFLIPNPILFWYQIFTIPNPLLFSIPYFFDTESETIKKMEKFRNWEVLKPKRHTLIQHWQIPTMVGFYHVIRLASSSAIFLLWFPRKIPSSRIWYQMLEYTKNTNLWIQAFRKPRNTK